MIMFARYGSEPGSDPGPDFGDEPICVEISVEGMIMLVEDQYAVLVRIIRDDKGDACVAAVRGCSLNASAVAVGRGETLLAALENLETDLRCSFGRP